MKISFENNLGNFTLSLEGRLDTTTAPELEAFVKDNIKQTDSLTINCEKLEYVSSAGLRTLLMAQKMLKSNLKLVKVQELVMEVFEITGFADVLTIE